MVVIWVKLFLYVVGRLLCTKVDLHSSGLDQGAALVGQGETRRLVFEAVDRWGFWGRSLGSGKEH
jgi:hypothetical protein